MYEHKHRVELYKERGRAPQHIPMHVYKPPSFCANAHLWGTPFSYHNLCV